MAFDKTNTGVLFINKTRKSPNSPNFSGNINIDGVEHRIVGWTKVGKTGDKFISISVDEPVKKEEPKEEPAPEIKTVDISEIPDEIPF